MLKKIKKTGAKKVCGAKPQCFVLFVLSHGDEVNGEESMIGTDGKHLTKTQVMDALSDANCPNLAGVPRVLFFCCCRGSM